MLNFKYVPPAKVKMKIQNSIPNVRDKQQIPICLPSCLVQVGRQAGISNHNFKKSKTQSRISDFEF